jgi:hypothetical protein
MAESVEDGERVRQHVLKVLAQLRALKDQQCAREQPERESDARLVEVDREEDTPRSVGGLEGPS